MLPNTSDLDDTRNARASRLNERLAAASLPVRVADLSTIWTHYYPRVSDSKWMLQPAANTRSRF